MINKKYISAYKSVCVPEDMLVKISLKQRDKKSFDIKRFIPIAACIAVMLSILPCYIGFTNPTVTVSDNAPYAVAAARHVGIQIPITLDLSRNTSVSVSKGYIEGIDSQEINGKAELIWNIDPSEITDCKLTLSDFFGTTTYILTYNENNGSWSITKT